MAIFFSIFTLCVLMCQPASLFAQEEQQASTETIKRKAPAAQKPVQYVYIPYTPGQPMPPLPQQAPSTNPNAAEIQYVYVPNIPGQQPSAPIQHAPKPSDDGPNVTEVMATFAGVLGGIVAMGMGAEYGNPEQEAQGLNAFIQNGTQLISILTRSPYTEEQFIGMYIHSAQKLERSRTVTAQV